MPNKGAYCAEQGSIRCQTRDLALLHMALGLTANRKSQVFPALPVVSGDFSLTACHMEQLTTKTKEGAAIEVKECIYTIIKSCLKLVA